MCPVDELKFEAVKQIKSLFGVLKNSNPGDTDLDSNPNWALDRTKEVRVYKGKTHSL